MARGVRWLAAPVAILGLAASAFSAEAESVSIVNLIASPEKYDGKPVIITGFLALDFEGSAVYLHKEDYENSIYKNGLWCSIDLVKYRPLDHKYVCIEAVFDAKGKGHLGLWSGQIKEVRRVWEPVKPQKAEK